MQKEEIFEAIKTQQENIINEIKKQINQLEKGDDLDESEVILRDDLSHQDEPAELILRYKERLNTAELDLRRLELTPVQKHDKVELGALLNLGDRFIYCCISVPEFTYKNNIILGVSDLSPLYIMLEGEQKGYKFELGNKQFEITEIS